MKIEAYINMMADLRAENEELKERLNYIESKLKSIKQQLAPKEYQFSENEKTIFDFRCCGVGFVCRRTSY